MEVKKGGEQGREQRERERKRMEGLRRMMEGKGSSDLVRRRQRTEEKRRKDRVQEEVSDRQEHNKDNRAAQKGVMIDSLICPWQEGQH